MNTLITVTVQKTRENEGIGASLWQIVWMFLVQGMVVGNRRHVLRLARGMMLIRYRNEFRQWLANTLGIEVFPRQICQFSQIPAEVIPGDVAKISIIAFIICSLAALIPAISGRTLRSGHGAALRVTTGRYDARISERQISTLRRRDNRRSRPARYRSHRPPSAPPICCCPGNNRNRRAGYRL